MIRRPPIPPLFPYTPLFRSHSDRALANATGSPEVYATAETPLSPLSAPSTLLPSAARAASLFLTTWRAARLRAHSRGSKRSEEHTSELQSRQYLVCRLLLDK